MIKITCKINGKTVNFKNIKDSIESFTLKGIEEHIRKSVGNIRCDVHRKYPQILVEGRNLDKLSFKVSGCCQELIDKVSKKLR